MGKIASRPRLKEVVCLIARFRVFIGRKGDGEPGVETLWLGMHDLRLVIQVAEILREAGRWTGNAVQIIDQKREKIVCNDMNLT